MKPLFFAYKMRTKAPKYKDLIFQRLLIERMQQLRFEHGYSQEDVIESTHLDISRYESGSSSPSTQSILSYVSYTTSAYRIFLHQYTILRKKKRMFEFIKHPFLIVV